MIVHLEVFVLAMALCGYPCGINNETTAAACHGIDWARWWVWAKDDNGNDFGGAKSIRNDDTCTVANKEFGLGPPGLHLFGLDFFDIVAVNERKRVPRARTSRLHPMPMISTHGIDVGSADGISLLGSPSNSLDIS